MLRFVWLGESNHASGSCSCVWHEKMWRSQLCVASPTSAITWRGRRKSPMCMHPKAFDSQARDPSGKNHFLQWFAVPAEERSMGRSLTFSCCSAVVLSPRQKVTPAALVLEPCVRASVATANGGGPSAVPDALYSRSGGGDSERTGAAQRRGPGKSEGVGAREGTRRVRILVAGSLDLTMVHLKYEISMYLVGDEMLLQAVVRQIHGAPCCLAT